MSAEEALLRHRPGFERPTDAVNLLFKKINRVGTDSATPTLPTQRYPTLRVEWKTLGPPDQRSETGYHASLYRTDPVDSTNDQDRRRHQYSYHHCNRGTQHGADCAETAGEQYR